MDIQKNSKFTKSKNWASLITLGIGICLSFDGYAALPMPTERDTQFVAKIVSTSDYQIGTEGLPLKKDTGITRHLTSLYSGESGNSVTEHGYLSDIVWIETNHATAQERILYYSFNVGAWKHKLNSETSVLMQAFITQPLLVFLPDDDKTDVANYLVETPLFKEAVKSHKNLLSQSLNNTPSFNDSLSALGEAAVKHLNATQKQNSAQVFKAEYSKEFGTIQYTTSYAAKIIANTNLTLDAKSSSFDIFDGMKVKGTADKQLEFTSNSTLYYGVQKVTDFENQKGGFTDLISRHFLDVPLIDPVIGWAGVLESKQKKTSLDISSSTLTPLDKVNQSVDVAVFMNNPNSYFDAPMAMNLVNVGGLVLKVAGINFSVGTKELKEKFQKAIGVTETGFEYASMGWSIAKSAQKLVCTGIESKEGMCGDYFKKIETIGNLLPNSYKSVTNTLSDAKNDELKKTDFNSTIFCGNAAMKALSFGFYNKDTKNTPIDNKNTSKSLIFICSFDFLITKPLLDNLKKSKSNESLYKELQEKGYVDKSVLLSADFIQGSSIKLSSVNIVKPKYQLPSLVLALAKDDPSSLKNILLSINYALDSMTSELKFFNSVFISGEFDDAVFTNKLKNIFTDLVLDKVEKAAGDLIYNAIKSVTPAKYVELAVILGNEGTALAYDWATDPSVIKLKMKQLPNNQLQIVHSVPDMEAARYLSSSSLNSMVNYSEGLTPTDAVGKTLLTSPFPDSNHLLVNTGFTTSVENQTIFAKVDRGNIDKLLKDQKVSVMWHVKRFDNSSDARTLLKSERTAANSFGYVKGKPSNNYKSTNNITGLLKSPVIDVNPKNPAYKNIAAAKLPNAQAIDFTKVYNNFMGKGNLTHITSGIYSDFTDISITATDGTQKSYQNTFNVYVLPELNNVESVNLDAALNNTSRIYCKSYPNCSEVQVNFSGNLWDKIAGRNGLHAVWMSSVGNVKSESINVKLQLSSEEQNVLRIPSDVDVSSDYLVIYEDVLHGYLQKSGKSMSSVLTDAFFQRLSGDHYPVVALRIGKLEQTSTEILVRPLDTDNDGVLDEFDAFPLDNQWQDDTDEDGMPDQWETQYGLDMNVNDAKLDKNKNGISNLDEFKAKFDPSLTIPTIAATASAGDGKVVVTWNKLAGFDKQNVCYITTWAITDVFDCVSDRDSTSLESQTSPVTVNNLTNGKTYYFVVGAVNSTKSFATSNVIAVTPKAEAVIKPEGFPTSGYTKIANDGSKLADSANLGANPKDWACTRDNKTGLIWEVKTTDGGLRDMNNTYSWYEPDASKNGGFASYKNSEGRDTYTFTNAVNSQGLCGAKDWRMPNNEELKGLVYCSDNQTKTLGKEEYGYICRGSSRPTINTSYFPNTQNYWFWSASVYADYTYDAWVVDFSDGYGNRHYKDNYYAVRLVRGGQ